MIPNRPTCVIVACLVTGMACGPTVEPPGKKVEKAEPTSRGLPFDTKKILEVNFDNAPELKTRHVVTSPSTSQEDLMAYVGLILVVDESRPGESPRVFDGTSVIAEVRPGPDELKVSPIDRILYQGKVAGNASVGGNAFIFSANLKANQAAEVIIKDEFRVGYKDLSKIPKEGIRSLVKRLHEEKKWEKMRYYFIESATLTSVVHKTYHDAGADATVTGTAFGANGKVFASDEGYIYDGKICIEPRDLAYYISPDFGPRSLAPNLPADALRMIFKKEDWSEAEGQRISQAIKVLTDPTASADLQGAKIIPPRRAPGN